MSQRDNGRGPQPVAGSHLLLSVGGALLRGLFLCCAVVTAIGCFGPDPDKKKLADANRRWDAGQKAEAVADYQELIDRDSKAISGDDERRPLYQRVIEYEFHKGNTKAARVWALKALDNKVALTSDSEEVREFYAHARAYREVREAEKQAAEAKREKQERLAEAKRMEEAAEAEAKRAAAQAKRQEEERLAEAKRKEADIKRRTDAWRAEREDKAHELAKKGDAQGASEGARSDLQAAHRGGRA